MKFLALIMTLSFALVACNKGPKTEYKEQKQEANKEYRQHMDDVREDAMKAKEKRDKEIEKAHEDLHEKQAD